MMKNKKMVIKNQKVVDLDSERYILAADQMEKLKLRAKGTREKGTRENEKTTRHENLEPWNCQEGGASRKETEGVIRYLIADVYQTFHPLFVYFTKEGGQR